MNFASQSMPGPDAARGLVADIDRWSRQGRRLTSPAWFPLLVTAVAILAAPSAGLLLGGSANAYWAVAAPLSAVLTGWFFASRRVQAPAGRGIVVLAAGVVMLAVVLGFVGWFGSDASAAVPWLVIGGGFAVFAVAWRSLTTGVFAAIVVITTVVVAVAGWDTGDLILSLTIGFSAAAAALVDLVRADQGRR